MVTVTWNPSDKDANITLGGSNLIATKTGGSGAKGVGGTSDLAKTSGAWYFEIEITDQNGTMFVGVTPTGSDRTVDVGQNADCFGYRNDGGRYLDGSFTGSAYSSYTTGDIIGIEIDIDNNTIEFYKNNVSQGTESVTLDGTNYVPAISMNTDNDDLTLASTAAQLTYSSPSNFTPMGATPYASTGGGINSDAINTYTINGSTGFSIIGSGELISIEQTVERIESGELVSIEQTVGLVASGEFISIEQDVAKIGSGSLVDIEQDIALRLSSTSPAEFISIEQIVKAVYSSSNIAAIEQKVKGDAPDHLSRTGWDCTLTIGGRIIPNSEIVGNITINRTENDAALMDITLMPPTGNQDIESYHGKTVKLDIETASGIYRAYTGVVDIPDIDLYEEKITLRCTDRRTELLNSQLPGIVSTIGTYSSNIFRIPRDTAEEVEQRLTTTPYAVDFDAYGNYTITSWTPKTTADFTLGDSDIYRQSPQVEFTSRGRITNKVNIKMQYRYQRLHHLERNFSWTSPLNDNFCLALTQGYTIPLRSLVTQAAESVGWPIKSGITFTNFNEGGWYRCGSTLIGYFPGTITGETVNVTDENGNNVTDASGNAVTTTNKTGITNYSNLFCLGATWTGTTRWSQTVTEEYTLSINAPQSQTQYGTITEDLVYSIDEDTDISEWENYTAYSTPESGGGSGYTNRNNSRASFNNAINVALQQAKTAILGSHRDTRVTFDTFIRPDFDLKHTINLNTTDLQAKGKVFNIRHMLNIGTGEAKTTTTLVLSRIQGSTSESALTIPSTISDTVSYPAGTITLGNHYGKDPDSQDAPSWNGYIGNTWSSQFYYDITEQFIVDVPPIPDELRSARTLTSSSSYNISIPNNTLTINFDGQA